MDDWIKIQDPSVCFIAENHFRAKDMHKIKGRGWKKIFHIRVNRKLKEQYTY